MAQQLYQQARNQGVQIGLEETLEKIEQNIDTTTVVYDVDNRGRMYSLSISMELGEDNERD
jgi:DNA invertase Pin-like site-specific DNA recombinase